MAYRAREISKHLCHVLNSHVVRLMLSPTYLLHFYLHYTWHAYTFLLETVEPLQRPWQGFKLIANDV